MEANEYIKKYGVDCAKEILKHNQDLMNISFFIDLKRLVESLESLELVEEYGGLDRAKEQAERFRLNTCIKMHGFMCRIIADVESCQ